MRLIDADRLLGILEREQEQIKDIPTRVDGLIDAIMDVLSAPTVDAVEVVRCKDCKHYGFTDNRIPEEQVWWCYFWDDVRSHEAYCSDGERKDGDNV